ncbi:serine/threonine-protein kinase 33-like isoform X2 [Lineus longissimus]
MSSSRPQGSADVLRSVPHTRIEDESMIEETYRFGRKLGQGSFGVVREGTCVSSGQAWAIKIINKESKDSKDRSSAFKLLEREVAILKRVKHEHIIHLEEVYETSKKIYLVMELCDGGELADALRERELFTENETKTIMRKLASAISYLHKNDIVHRDLKLENILLSQNPNDPHDKLHIKVTDFGLSVVKDGVGHENMMQAFCGTPIYMSPEIIDNKTYSQQCDVWAMGVITYLLLCGNPPFRSREEEKLYEMIKKGDVDFSAPVFDKITEEAKNLICGMLKVDPAHRLTAREVLEHSWFTGKELTAGPTNVLEMMKQWKDLDLDTDSSESCAINGEQGAVADKSKEKDVPTRKVSSSPEKKKTSLNGMRRASTGMYPSLVSRRPINNITKFNSLSNKPLLPVDNKKPSSSRSTVPGKNSKSRSPSSTSIISQSTRKSSPSTSTRPLGTTATPTSKPSTANSKSKKK